MSYTFQKLKVTFPSQYVLHVELNNSEKLNAFDRTLWNDVKECFMSIEADSTVRVAVISGAGKLFSAGIDFNTLSEINEGEVIDFARKAYYLRRYLRIIQDSFTAIENCNKPVIAVVHNACIGAGVDLITACDIRYCSQDAYFCIKEVDLGLAADIGTLQRLPKIVGNNSLVRELCFTGRKFSSTEALNFGLVNKILQTKEIALAEAFKAASIIASKSPVAIAGTKHLLNYSRDHSVNEGLEYTALWNSAMLNSKDLIEAFKSSMAKVKPTFAKL
ncbi:11770_t:CDS:10 [Dentiscutata erythropus]|uniref:11770_t:CDS:1 n=1 Tax=Dentiscutata erythropus TaxID=1348616 RepID=A0A9N8ZFN7_9GLOM|nr:11770_t:CDS:10 [Dentiscutata erythropus]